MRKSLFILFLAVVVWLGACGTPVLAQQTTKTNTQQVLPVPKGVNNLLFYVQRDPNINTIVYELNVNSKGVLDEKEPVKIYWLRYGDGEGKKDLSYIQRKFAYGLHVKKISAEKYELTFVSYGKRTFHLMKGTDGKFHVYATINNKQAILNRVFVRIEGGSFWVPNVVYAEFNGLDPATEKEVMERFNP
jgi:hypothetical protein